MSSLNGFFVYFIKVFLSTLMTPTILKVSVMKLFPFGPLCDLREVDPCGVERVQQSEEEEEHAQD